MQRCNEDLPLPEELLSERRKFQCVTACICVDLTAIISLVADLILSIAIFYAAAVVQAGATATIALLPSGTAHQDLFLDVLCRTLKMKERKRLMKLASHRTRQKVIAKIGSSFSENCILG